MEGVHPIPSIAVRTSGRSFAIFRWLRDIDATELRSDKILFLVCTAIYVFKIFYSWQSDLDPKANRNLIQGALDRACRSIKTEGGVIAEAVVERDTLGLPGAPSIVDAVLSKIRDCDVFVADVSSINHASPTQSAKLPTDMPEASEGGIDEIQTHQTPQTRPCPNPNVLVELGYAMSHLGNEALVLVVNTFYGPIENLPFDLRSLRVMQYRAKPGDELGAVRKELQRDLENAIRSIASVARGDPVDSILYQRTRNVEGQARGLFGDLGRAAGVIGPTFSEAQVNKAFDGLTEQQCINICKAINPNSEAPLFVGDGFGGGRKAVWLECMLHWRKRSGSFSAQVMDFSPFLKREHAALLMRVEHSSYFKQIEVLGMQVGNNTLEWIAPNLWKYFRSASDLAAYAERELARRAVTF